MARRALCRHPPKVGAVCGNSARTDLCGGRSAMSVPTANSLMSDLGFPGVFKLPRIHEAGQMMQPVHGAGDGGPNRWLSYSHPRIFTA